MDWRGGLLFDREILSELLQKSIACPRRCFVHGVRIQDSRKTGFHIHLLMVRVFDSLNRDGFINLLQLLSATTQQQTDAFVKFHHLTHKRSQSSNKQVRNFCVPRVILQRLTLLGSNIHPNVVQGLCHILSHVCSITGP